MPRKSGNKCPPELTAVLPPNQYGSMIVVRVGPSKHEFYVHKGLLSHHCLYYKNLFEGNWKDEDGLNLIDADVNAFKALFNWLYCGQLPDIGQKSDGENDKQTECHWMEFSNIYVLGDALQIPALKNAVTDGMIDYFIRTRRTPHGRGVEFLFDNTPKSSEGRMLLADMVVATEGSKWASIAEWALGNDLVVDFGLQMLASICRMMAEGGFKPRSDSQWRNLDKCKYHDHNSIRGKARPRGDGK